MLSNNLYFQANKKRLTLLLLLSTTISFFSACSKEEILQISPSHGPFPYKLYEGTLWLSTQNDVNNFKKLNYTHVEGPVMIGNALVGPPIVSLVGLESLKNIGDLTINYTNLIDLEGLNNLDSLKGLKISENPDLKSLKGLHNVSLMRGSIIIIKNGSLREVTALSGTKINTALRVDVVSNPNLIGLEGLEGLMEVEAGLVIKDNPSLLSLRGLKNLKHVRLHLAVVNNPSLYNLNGLENFESANALGVFQNAMLLSLEGLSSLKDLKYLRIGDNKTLDDFCLLTNYISSDSDVKVYILGNKYNPSWNMYTGDWYYNSCKEGVYF